MKAQVSHRFSQVRPELSLLVTLFDSILGEPHKREGERQPDAKNVHGIIRGSDGCHGERCWSLALVGFISGFGFYFWT